MPQAISVEAALDKRAKASQSTIKRTPRVQSITKRRSIATIWTVSQLLERYGDPRVVLLEIASLNIDEIVQKTGCTPFEALAEKRLCAQAVLPYVAQKLPVQVDMRHTRAIHLNIVDQTQYQELQAIADGTDATHIEAQLVTAISESEREDDAQAHSP